MPQKDHLFHELLEVLLADKVCLVQDERDRDAGGLSRDKKFGGLQAQDGALWPRGRTTRAAALLKLALAQAC